MNNKKLTIIVFFLVLLMLTGLFLIKEKNNKISNQELKNLIGQMIIIGFRGVDISDNPEMVNNIENLNLGGVILFDYDIPSKSFPRNIVNPEQTKKLIEDLQENAKTPLLIAIDAEGGLINRLKEKYGFAYIPSAEELRKDNIKKTKDSADILASQLTTLGINTNFAPVVDLNINPNNPVIGSLGRSFSDKPEEVINYAIAFISAHKEQNIITAIKHFPGHGSSENDSHKGLTDITNTYQEKELIPFKELIEKGVVDITMTAHIMNRNIDPNYPATLSPKFLENILKKELNFKGVIVSDDMQMKAISDNFGFEESIIMAINAGCDILIFSNNGDIYDNKIGEKAINIIYEAVMSGKIEKERIINASNKILSLKQNYLIKKRQ